MALENEHIKEMLSLKYQALIENIEFHELNKEDNQISRIFTVNDIEIVVISDISDKYILDIYFPDEDITELISNSIEDYIFAMSKVSKGFAEIFIVEKSYWEQHRWLDVSGNLPIIDLLPKYIYPVDQSALSIIKCDPMILHDDVVAELKECGLTYSNDLAQTLNSLDQDLKCVMDFSF